VAARVRRTAVNARRRVQIPADADECLARVDGGLSILIKRRKPVENDALGFRIDLLRSNAQVDSGFSRRVHSLTSHHILRPHPHFLNSHIDGEQLRRRECRQFNNSHPAALAQPKPTPAKAPQSPPNQYKHP
jgi:hypothetical protein